MTTFTITLTQDEFTLVHETIDSQVREARLLVDSVTDMPQSDVRNGILIAAKRELALRRAVQTAVVDAFFAAQRETDRLDAEQTRAELLADVQ